jgi:hypothetical protein
MEKENKVMLSASFFRKYGFSKPVRFWDKRLNQFSIYYKIEGYDCDILIKPSPQVVPNNWNAYGEGVHKMPAEIQVDEFSDIDMLENHHIGNFGVYVNSLENHVATFYYEYQLLNFMSLCGRPLVIK